MSGPQANATLRRNPLGEKRASLEQRLLPSGIGAWPLDAEVFICQMCCHPAAWGAIEKANLDEEWLVDFLDRVRFFGERRRQGVHAHRPALVFLDDGQQQLAVDLVEAVTIDLEHLQRGLGGWLVDLARAAHLRVVAHPA